MKRTAITVAILCGLVAPAPAHETPCCAAKTCPAGCPNEGRRCIGDAAENAGDSLEEERLHPAGCVDGEGDVCAGGRTGEAGFEGCVALGPGRYFLDGDLRGPVTRDECIAAAVDACCAAGACH